MLSELCVRRPVFATMLVMSLVVLGIFSFRDLGVDLFPKADPAHGQRVAAAAGRVARRDDLVGHHADGERAQRHRRHRPDDGERQRRRHRQHHHPVRPRTRPRRRRQHGARKGGRRDAQRAAGGAAAGHPEAGSGRRSDHEPRALEQEREPPHAHRDRRQAGEARARIGRRRRRRHDERRSPARNPHRRRRREAQRARAVDRSGARRHSQENVEIPGGTLEQGKWEVGPAHAGPHRRDATVQRHHHRHASTARRCGSPTSATPRIRSQKRRDLAVHGRRQSGRPARHPPRLGREHHQGHRRRSSRSWRPSGRRCRPTSRSRSPPTTRSSSTRRSPRSRNTCSGAACWRRWSCCSSSATSAR